MKGPQRREPSNHVLTAYFVGGVVPLLLGEAAGGQGVPEGVVPVPGCDEPGLLPALLLDVEGDAPELDESGFAEFEFAVPAVEPPGSDVEAFGVPAVPGMFPQGEPLGVVPGVFCVLGFTVDGCVLLPGVGVFGEFDPGTLPDCPLGDVPGCVCGVAVPAGGVAVLDGGVAVLAGGVAVLDGGVAVPGGGVADRGAELCPAFPPAGALLPPAGALWATAQAAHNRTTNSNGAFITDISSPPAREI